MAAAQKHDVEDSVEVLEHSIAGEEPAFAEKIELLPYVLTTHGVHMAIRKSHPNAATIVEDFNRILRQMQADGSLDVLLEKHLQN